jgi:integrase
MASKLQKKNGKWTFRYFEGGRHKRYICSAPTKQDDEQERIDFLHVSQFPSNKYDLSKLIWQNVVSRFISYAKVNKKEVHSYSVHLAKLADFINPKKISDITAAKISDYREHRLKSGVSKSTINRELSSVSSFFTWLKTIEGFETLKNPLNAIKKFKVKKIVNTRILSKDEISRLFYCLKNNKTPEGLALNFSSNTLIALNTIFHLALYAGLRLKETKLLLKDDVLFNENSIRVEPHKTSMTNPNPAIIPLHPKLKNYLLPLYKQYPKEKYVVPFIADTLRDSRENSSSTFASKLLKRIGIKDASIHTCRHTYISVLANSGIDSMDILKYARITSLEVLEIYRRITPQKHQENIQKIDY